MSGPRRSGPSRLRETAPAKVNLFLAVGPLRGDGYHHVLTLFEPVSLVDRVTVLVKPSPDGRWRVGLSVSGRAPVHGPPLPRGPDNLAWRAADLYIGSLAGAVRPDAGREDAAVAPAHLEIHLEKVIPVAAGLGGGSSDAAAVLRALHRYFRDRGRSVEDAGLHHLAAELGSDVRYFLRGGRAVGRSRGEVVSPAPPGPPLHLVLGLWSSGLSTLDVYREFDRIQGGSGWAWAPPEGDLDDLVRALAAGRLDEAAPLLRNDLQPAAASLRPEVEALTALLVECGCAAALVSGSGPTVFGLVRGGPGEAAAIAREANSRLPPGLREVVRFVPTVSRPGLEGAAPGDTEFYLP